MSTYDGDNRTPRATPGTSTDGGKHLASTGKTRWLKQQIFKAVAKAGSDGVTVREFEDWLQEWGLGIHHGQVSSAFSTMHEDGFLARLTLRRQRYEVYVMSSLVRDRPTREHASVIRRRREDAIIEAVDAVSRDFPVQAMSHPLRDLIVLVDPREKGARK